MHRSSALIHFLVVAVGLIKLIERVRKRPNALATHSFSPVVQLLVFSIAEYRGCGVILAVFCHGGGVKLKRGTPIPDWLLECCWLFTITTLCDHFKPMDMRRLRDL